MYRTLFNKLIEAARHQPASVDLQPPIKGIHFIEVPDQDGYVQKRGCKKCIDEIMVGSGLHDKPA